MLYVALVLGLVLLLAVNLIAWRVEHPVGIILATCIFAGLASLGFLLVALPPVVLEAALVGAAALLCGRTEWRSRSFLLLSCLATLLAFSIFTYFAFRQTKQLREEFAFVSMEDRLPVPKSKRVPTPLPPMTGEQLGAVESRITDGGRKWLGIYRTNALWTIHEDTVATFINQPGFGARRMNGFTYLLRFGAYQTPPTPQPGSPSPSSWSSESLKQLPTSMKAQNDLLSYHEASLVDFVNPAGFGYVKDREHVAGFQEHLISQPPSPPGSLMLQHLDLIGLVRHDEPTAYVSYNLPRMDELRKAPTRPLDDFENAGLLALQRGDDLFLRERGTEWRMLGSIRAARQCVVCHGCERGDLLGAFSYRLTMISARAEKPGER